MNDVKKNDLNKSYYLRNKERILEKARLRAQVQASCKAGSGSSVVSLFKKPDVELPKPKVSQKPIVRREVLVSGAETAFLFGLVGLMTSFLLYETMKFFLVTDENWRTACLKAVILEGAAIAFTLMQGRGRFGSVFNKVMVFLIYSFGIWVVSYPIVSSTQALQAQADIRQKTIRELEGEASKKEAIRDQYWKQDRVTFARKYDQSLDELRNRLDVERKGVVEVPQSRLDQSIVLAGILFRILTMVSNFYCVQYLKNRKSALS